MPGVACIGIHGVDICCCGYFVKPHRKRAGRMDRFMERSTHLAGILLVACTVCLLFACGDVANSEQGGVAEQRERGSTGVDPDRSTAVGGRIDVVAPLHIEERYPAYTPTGHAELDRTARTSDPLHRSGDNAALLDLAVPVRHLMAMVDMGSPRQKALCSVGCCIK